MLTTDQADRILAGLPTRGHQAAQYRAALKLLASAPPARVYHDAGVDPYAGEDEEFEGEYAHLFKPTTAAETARQARRREQVVAAAAAALDDDDALYLSIFGPDEEP
jgi:hypothetical protein